MNLQSKLAILADAAKYDASCASSGAAPRNSVGGRGMGSTEGMGICHSYAPDGRCISLLKILLTNFCQYDCLYCVNRVTSNVPRARFTVDEVVRLTLDFYRRNCIEGLFLSSGIIRNGDYTMEQLVEVARSLREDHRFAGYIHLKTIPEASPELLAAAGRYADRLSINIELPTVQGLAQLAPDKSSASIHQGMGQLHQHIRSRPQTDKTQHLHQPAGVLCPTLADGEGSGRRRHQAGMNKLRPTSCRKPAQPLDSGTLLQARVVGGLSEPAFVQIGHGVVAGLAGQPFAQAGGALPRGGGGEDAAGEGVELVQVGGLGRGLVGGIHGGQGYKRG